MKKKLHILCLLFASIAFGQITITPNPFEVNESITITVDINSTATDCDGITNPGKVYLHSGVGPDSDPWTYVIGNWGQDDGVGEMTNMGGGLWQITLTPETYYGLNPTQAANITRMGMVFRNENGTQEFKDNGCTDFFFDVGAFQTTLVTPDNGSTTILASGSNFTITANNTGGSASYVLKANGSTINSNSGVSYTYTDTNITENKNYALEVTLGGTTITRSFNVVINPGTSTQAMAAGMEDGINYDADTSKATLVLDAPGKDFIYVAGSFNNWQPDGNYAMRRDGATGKFWLELTGLTPGQNYTYQYWVVDETPIAGSPAMVKTADPYSTLVLSPFDDPFIPATTYPNLPAYPAGQEREVTVLQTGQTPYNWQVQNFVKPKKEDLIIYEVLIRDFDANKNYQDLIDRIDYFKDLKVNAIQLMPIMEFEGNESWGYNTSFHLALDKYYGTADKFKEFVDLCHQNGIAVILDLALNHAFGRNPLVRMWMNDPDNDGWGEPSADSPYFNQIATHSYSVGSDFNHQQTRTQYYTERVVKHWIEEYKIDGFRWDLTKGFTQECTAPDEGCTNGYRNDRVALLKQYADYSWSLDDTHYVIFEHLGQDNEEKEWADYRLSEGKGIMLWGKMTDQYNQLTMGFASNADISRMGHTSRGFNGKRLIGYAESHDEERLMYRNLQFGNTALASHNVQDLNTSLSRMSALGAASLMIPGPKMIWHFASLGMENSIFTCTNGSVNTPADPTPGDCKLDTKPQPQWTNNWMADPNRRKIYDDWARLIQLKIDEPVFEGNYSISPYINDIRQRIYVWDDNLPSSDLKNVVILCNFSVADLSIVPDFPYTGTWYDLMDVTGNTTITVNNTAAPITIPAGQFRIFGNQESILSNEEFQSIEGLLLYPNPASNNFKINQSVEEVQILDIAGREIKTFEGGFAAGYNFDVSELTNALYLVKIVSNKGTATKRLLID
ncbi:MAG: alpha-amylase family glycosyl hydrolase [Bacteroidota bacterium]